MGCTKSCNQRRQIQFDHLFCHLCRGISKTLYRQSPVCRWSTRYRKKILEQNKWVTHGILFDVNSANIKPESYGTLKEMADVLKEYADLKVKIVGHTDADGKDADNLDLSKRRAASVKAALAKEFGINETRMETDGKGESEAIDKNDNPAGKANNRRVEFIKL